MKLLKLFSQNFQSFVSLFEEENKKKRRFCLFYFACVVKKTPKLRPWTETSCLCPQKVQWARPISNKIVFIFPFKHLFSRDSSKHWMSEPFRPYESHDRKCSPCSFSKRNSRRMRPIEVLTLNNEEIFEMGSVSRFPLEHFHLLRHVLWKKESFSKHKQFFFASLDLKRVYSRVKVEKKDGALDSFWARRLLNHFPSS